MSFRYVERLRDDLKSLFDAWVAATGDDVTVVAKRFAGDGSFYKRLSLGRTKPATADLIVQRFSDDWPPNVEWPVAVPRPPRGKWDDLKAGKQSSE